MACFTQIATFACNHVSSTLPDYTGPTSVVSNKDGTHAWRFPIPCYECSRRMIGAEEDAIKARYEPQIHEWRAQIQRAEERLRRWRPVNELLMEAKNERVRAVRELQGEMERRVQGVGKAFVRRWGVVLNGDSEELGEERYSTS